MAGQQEISKDLISRKFDPTPGIFGEILRLTNSSKVSTHLNKKMNKLADHFETPIMKKVYLDEV